MILIGYFCFICFILTSQTTYSEQIGVEYDFISSMDKLKRMFMRNGMTIFGNENDKENDENTPARNSEILIPVDEIPLFRSNRGLNSENIETIQGDMIIDQSNSRSKRRIIANSVYGNPTRWPNGIIPFEFDSDATESLKAKFNLAVQIWHENSCIRFEPYSPNKHQNHRSRVLVKNRGHCAARVGYSVDPGQKVGISDVYLPEHCPLGSVLHELGHVIGFRHEHTRYDRTDHINVHYERMQTSQRPQYDIMDNGFPGYFGIYYDLYSIMHYSAQNGLIESKDEKRSFLMGQRFNLSFSDIKMANQAYVCKDRCLNKTIKCENEGFIDENCKCRCPEHITGRFCETIMTKRIILKTALSPRLTCDFENDLCDWSQENSRDSEEWIRNSGFTKTQINFKKENNRFRTGPQLIEENRKNSTYIYLNSYDQTKAYANSILISPQILVNKTEQRCLKFYYHMFSFPSFKMDAPEIGSLRVKLRFSNGGIKKIWEKFGNQGEKWQFAQVDLHVEPPHTMLFFEAEVIDWKYGDIAIDDIEFNHGSCSGNDWSDWGSWTECSQPCNTGLKSRQRSCLGNSCRGNSTEYSECNQFKCPEDEWEPWSICSAECGEGYEHRFKKCFENNCQKIQEVRPCKIKECSKTINEWSDWSQCSTKCGYGTKTRLKNCLKSDEKCEMLMERKVCFLNESCPVKKWTEWSEWSDCSNKCGQGYSIRIRECLLNTTCDGLKKELRVCLDLSNCPKPVWSDWSLWSNCITQQKCSKGVKVRRRFCLMNQKLVSNSECLGDDTESVDCIEVCEPHLLEPQWSQWSNCTSTCGNGLMTRQKKCPGSKCTDEFIYDQKTCSKTHMCPLDYNFMECTFDRPEYCPLEQIEKGNSEWEIDGPTLYSYSKFKLTPSLMSGGQFITLRGKNKRSSIQTPIISNEKIPKGQCLSFYYFANGDSRIEVNKVNLDGQIQFLAEKEGTTSKWKKISLLLQSSTDYFVEFTASTGADRDSIIAIDDITLSPFENCIILSCNFDNTTCKPNQVLGLTVSTKTWVVESFLKSNFSFLRVDMNQLVDDVPVFYGFPIISPSYSSMCLSFLYLLMGQGVTELRIGLVQGPKLLSYIWKEKTSSTKSWKKSFIDFQIEDEFQLMIELLKYKSNATKSEIIALDNFKVSYGTCNLLKKSIDFERDYSIPPKRDLLSANSTVTETCGGVFNLDANQSITIQSPGYPVSYPINLYCSYLIKTRANLRLKISLFYLDLEDNDRHDQCIDFLEIRYFNLGQPGPKYCGKLQKYNGEFTLTSFKNDLLLLFSSDWAVTKSGFKIYVKTV